MDKSALQLEFEDFLRRLRQGSVDSVPSTFYQEFYRLLIQPQHADDFLHALSLARGLKDLTIDHAVITAPVVIPASVTSVVSKWAPPEILDDLLSQITRLRVVDLSIHQQHHQHTCLDQSYTKLLREGSLESLLIKCTGYCHSRRSTPTNVEALTKGLQNNTTLQHLSLNIPTMNSDSFSELCLALQSSCVGSLVLPPILDMEQAASVRRLLSTCPSLRSVQLSAMRKPSDAFEHFTNVILSGLAVESCQVTSLHLRGFKLSVAAWEAIGRNSSLRTLHLEQCQVTDLEQVSLPHPLEHLLMSYTPVITQPEVLGSLAQRLRTLSVQALTVSTLCGAKRFASLLVSSQLSNLSIGRLKVVCEDTDADDAAHALIVSAIGRTTIERLAIGSFGRQDRNDIKGVFIGVLQNTHLKSLSLPESVFDSDDCVDSLRTLVAQGPLDELDLSAPRFKMTEKVVTGIAEGLATSTLHTLRLCSISSAMSLMWGPLYRSLEDPGCTLHSLDIRCYGADRPVAGFDWKAIAESISRWKSLIQLFTNETLICNDACILLEALKVNYTLQAIEGIEFHNSIQQAKADFYLTLNQHGRGLLKSKHSLQSSPLWPAILVQKNNRHPSAMFYFLRESHILMEQPHLREDLGSFVQGPF